MRCGFVQFAPRFGRTRENVSRGIELMNKHEADLFVLPELCNTGYVFRSEREVKKLSETVPEGESCQRWIETAEDKGPYIVAGIAERDGSGLYNSAVLIGPKGYVGTYRKSHLFQNEKRFFKPGDTGFRVFNVGPTRLGIMICFDWIFPEATRILALKGAEVIAHPSNLIFPYCMHAMRTRAIENRIFAITSNRTGTERGTTFHGESQIVAPDMKVLAKAGRSEEVRVVNINPADAHRKEYTSMNSLFSDRRIELYQELLS